MVLATSNWKPERPPEFQTMLTHHSVARLRNKVLKRLTSGDLFLFKHQQGPVDLEAFLIVTALLKKMERDAGVVAEVGGATLVPV